MGILEKEILINIVGYNWKYYQKLNYKDVSIGNKILVKIEDLPKGSGVNVTKICDNCGKKSVNQPYGSIIKAREKGDGIDRCHKCSTNINGIKQKNNIKYKNSFEYWSKENNKEYLLKEFSLKNERKPFQISYGNNDIYLWNCPDCKSEYPASINNRRKDKGCPYCTGKKVNHTNCLWTTHPEIAKTLRNLNVGYEITYGSNKTEEFICKNCRYVKKKKIREVVRNGFSCPKCGDGISYPEKFMFNILDQLNIKFEAQKIFNWSDSKRYDFYIPSLNIIIETHGEQHYCGKFETLGGKTLQEEQENDKLKEKLAKGNGLKNYIVIDCRYSQIEWIKNKILESKLNRIFDLSNIDWNKCHEFACNTILKDICNSWNKGIANTRELSNIFKMDRHTITRYLKQANKLGWCDYNPTQIQHYNGILAGKRRSKPIIQLSLENNYIKEWESAREASANLNINYSHISSVCYNKRKQTGGYKWMYKEDYDQYIKQTQINS